MAPEVSKWLWRLNTCSRRPVGDATRARLASRCHASHSDLATRKKRCRNLPRAPLLVPNKQLFPITALLLSLWVLSSRRWLLADSRLLCEQQRGRQHSCNRPSPACLAASPTRSRYDLLGQEWSCLSCSNTEPGL